MKQEITTVIYTPDGYEFDRIGYPKLGEEYVKGDFIVGVATAAQSSIMCVIIKKIKPRTKTFVCVSEDPRRGRRGEFYEDPLNGSLWRFDGEPSAAKYKIWKEVEE